MIQITSTLEKKLENNAVSALTALLFNTPLTDPSALKKLKEELSSGDYAIQSHSLAEKLIEHVHPLERLEMA